MIQIACTVCSSLFIIAPVDEQALSLFGPTSDWYPDKYPCPTDGCSANAEQVDAADQSLVINIVRLTPQEAWVAFNGVGLPGETECSVAALRSYFAASPVKSIFARMVNGSSRCTLDCIELMDGTRIHLGTSPHGAVVYRVSPNKKHSEALYVDNHP